jgi:hypothetical protein
MHEGSMNICDKTAQGYELKAREGNFNSLLREIRHHARVSGERYRKNVRCVGSMTIKRAAAPAYRSAGRDLEATMNAPQRLAGPEKGYKEAYNPGSCLSHGTDGLGWQRPLG